MTAQRTAVFLAATGAALAGLIAGCTSPEHDGRDEALTALRAEVAAAEAQNSIRSLMHAYGRLIDARDFDSFAKLWTDDAVYVGGPGSDTLVGGTAIADFLRKIITANPSGVGEPNFHVFFNEEIEVTGEHARATSMSTFVSPNASGAPTMVILARYEDEFVRQNGTWKFQRRVVHGLLPAPKAKSP
jgi:uncharacterized protein (TIGR02246 family)